MADLESEPLTRSDDVQKYGTLIQRKPDSRIEENAVSLDDSTVGRKIGFGSAYILVISRVIGSGIFAMPGTIVQTVGSPGLALTLWVVGAFVVWASLAVQMEYGCMLPRSGGSKVYLEYTYRKPRFLASTMVAAQAVFLGLSATNSIIFAKYTIFACGLEPSDLTTKILAVALLTTVTIIHGCFYKTGIWIQNILGWLKILLIGFMIITGFLVVLFRGRTYAEPVDSSANTTSWDDMWADSNWAWGNISTAFFKIFYSYAGLSNVNNVLNEVKNPVRTLKLVGPLSLATAATVYALVNVAYLAVVPLQEIKQSRELISALFFERVFGPGFGNVFLPFTIALSAVGNVMVVTFSLARLNQEIARQGFLPWSEVLASWLPFGAPLGGLFVHYVPTLLAITLPPSGSVYAFIADVEGYAGQFFTVAVALGLLLLRRKQPDLVRPFKAWLPGVWLIICLSTFLILAPLFPPASGTADVDFFYAAYALVGLSVLILGVAYWYVWTIAIPKYRGYQLEEERQTLVDGTKITKLVRKMV